MKRLLLLLFMVAALLPAVDFTKTDTELQAIANVADAAQDISTELSVAGHLSAVVHIDFAPEATNTNQTELRIEIAETDDSDCGTDAEDCLWVERWSTITTDGTVATNDMPTEAAGQTEIDETTLTGLTDGDGQILFIKDDTLANSEWVKVVLVTASTSYTIQDGLRFAHDSSDDWYNQAERFSAQIDLSGVQRIRVVCNNNYKTGSVAVNWRARIVTTDAIE